MSRKTAISGLLAVFAIATGLPLSAQQIWCGSDANDYWTNGQNWTGGIPPVSSPSTWLAFRDSSHLSPFADSYTPWVVNRIDFESRAYPGAISFTLSGNPLSFEGINPLIQSYAQGNEIINNDVEIHDSNLTIAGFLSGSIVFNGSISGSGGVIVTTTTAVFNKANSYTGSTQVGVNGVAGLSVTDAKAFGTSSSTSVIGNSYLYLSGGILIDPQPLTLSYSTLMSKSGNNGWRGDIMISTRGTINSANAGDTLDVSGAVNGQGGDLTITGAGNVTLSGTVNNLTQWGITKFGTGTLTLSGTTLNVPNIDIFNGILVIASSEASPAEAFVQLTPSTGNTNNPAYPTLSLLVDATIGGLSSYSTVGSATVQLGSSTLTIKQNFYGDYSGEITGTGSIIKDGTGTLLIDGPKSFSGGVVIKGGTIVINTATALGASPATPAINVTLDGGTLEARAYDQSYNTAPMTFDANRTVYIQSSGGFAGTYKPFTIPSLIRGPGTLVSASPSLVILSNPQNDFSGGTLISKNALQFNNAGAMGGGAANIKINANASAIAGYPINQSFLAHLDPLSSGIVVAGVSSSNSLDFGAAGLNNVRFDSVSGAPFSGQLIAPAYHLGGTTGGDLLLTAPDALSGNAVLDIAADSATGGIVTLANNNAITGSTTIRSGTFALTGHSVFNSGPIEVMAGGILKLAESTVVAHNTITIDAGGMLTGCGNITAYLVNNGTVLISDCGLQVTGNVTNNGTITLTGLGSLVAGGSFVNNGIIDLINSDSSQLPANIVNNGVVFDATHTPPLKISHNGFGFFITIQAIPNHTYILQRAARGIAAADWQDVASLRPSGAPSVTFSDYNAAAGSFYRVKILPQ